MDWFTLNMNKDGFKWQTDLTSVLFGETKLFNHDFKLVQIDSSYPGIGLTTEDFMTAKSQLINMKMEGLYCSDILCVGSNECSAYKGLIPDVSLTLSNRVTYEVKGDDLLLPVEGKKYQCEFLIHDSIDSYALGSVFLKDRYSVYDMDNFKMAIGPVFDFDAPVSSNDIDTDPTEKETGN